MKKNKKHIKKTIKGIGNHVIISYDQHGKSEHKFSVQYKLS